MTEAQTVFPDTLSQLPPRHRIAELYLADEARLVEQLIAQARFTAEEVARHRHAPLTDVAPRRRALLERLAAGPDTP